MKIKTLRVYVLAFACMLSAYASVGAQVRFSSADAGYAFDLPDDRWKMTVKPTAANPSVEYVFIERNEGHLEVRRINVKSDAIGSDVIRDEEQKLQFLMGYVAGREEQFGGVMRGNVFNFEYAKAGRPMSGRYYFLRADPGTVYVLRFSGYADKLRTIRNQTDAIARSFTLSAK